VRANVWYLRQTLSLISLRELLELPMQHLLRCMAVFTGAAGVWLAVMENILKHAGYPERTVIAVAIVVQGVATLLVPVIYVRSIFRVFVSTGAIALAFFGAYSVQRILAAQSFEGFVLLIGFALI